MKCTRPLILLLLFPCAFAGAQNIMDASRLSGAITLDGVLDESAWEEVTPLPYKMQQPQFGIEPSERSEVLLAYDEEYLYLGGRLWLSDSSYLRPTTFKRDAFDGTTVYRREK